MRLHTGDLFLPASTRIFAAACLAALLAGCGGSSGSSVAPAGFLLDSYAWTISNPTRAPASFSHTRAVPGLPDDTYSVSSGSGSIHGHIDRNTRKISFSPASTFSVDWSAGGTLPAAFTVAVMTAGELDRHTPWPDSGSYAVTWADNSIIVTYGHEILIQLNDEDPVTFSPPAFLTLDSSGSVPDWQRVAARSSQALTEMLQQAGSSFVFLERILDGEFDSGVHVRYCEVFPRNPPPGVQFQGESVVIFVGPGSWESIGLDCLSLFTAGPSAGTRGVLANASLQYRNLQLATDASGAVTSAGFVPTLGIAGGVLFTNARLSVVGESSPGSWNWDFTGEEVRRNGGFAITFAQP